MNGYFANLVVHISIVCPVSATSIDVQHSVMRSLVWLLYIVTYGKRTEYTPHAGHDDFIPIVFETYGRFHPSVNRFLIALCSKLSLKTGIPKSVLVNCWINRLSFILQEGESNLFNNRLSTSITLTVQDASAACIEYCVED